MLRCVIAVTVMAYDSASCNIDDILLGPHLCESDCLFSTAAVALYTSSAAVMQPDDSLMYSGAISFTYLYFLTYKLP